jgi:hypothetical protein
VAAAEEVSTAAAVLVVVAFTAAVVVLAVATMAEGTATAAIAVAGEWVPCTAADDMEGWVAVRRRAALEEDEVGPRVAVQAADGPAGAETEETFRTRLPTGSGTHSELATAGSQRRDSVASAELLIGAEATADAALVGVAVLGVIVASVGEAVGGVAGGLALASGLAGGRAGILFGIGRRIGIARGGTTGIRLTFIPIRTSVFRD